jgi:hypothetical protein
MSYWRDHQRLLLTLGSAALGLVAFEFATLPGARSTPFAFEIWIGGLVIGWLALTLVVRVGLRRLGVDPDVTPNRALTITYFGFWAVAAAAGFTVMAAGISWAFLAVESVWGGAVIAILTWSPRFKT